MKRLFPIVFLGGALLLRAMPDECAPMEHDPITARDLAAFLPAFGRLEPDTPIAPGPAPGVRRTLRSLELMSLARNYSLSLAAARDLCFDLPLEPLDRGRLLAAMQVALPLPETRIEVLETSLYPAPRGRIEFQREDLSAPARLANPAPVVWRGNVVYGSNQRFAIWARVLITARVARLVAGETIPAGKPISKSQVRLELVNMFPGPGGLASSPDQVAGRVALRSIPAGSEIHLNEVEPPPDVRRGDMVAVEVHSGATRIAFSGKSESDGHAGDTISIRNLRSNKVFQARVDGKDKVFVDANAPQGN